MPSDVFAALVITSAYGRTTTAPPARPPPCPPAPPRPCAPTIAAPPIRATHHTRSVLSLGLIAHLHVHGRLQRAQPPAFHFAARADRESSRSRRARRRSVCACFRPVPARPP